MNKGDDLAWFRSGTQNFPMARLPPEAAMDLLLAILRWICGLWNGEQAVLQPVPVRVVGMRRIVPGRGAASARLRAWGQLTHSISIRGESSWG